MEQNIKAYLPIDFNQIVGLVRQLSLEERERLIRYLKDWQSEEPTLTHVASEKVLAKDWLSPEEDEAWENL